MEIFRNELRIGNLVEYPSWNRDGTSAFFMVRDIFFNEDVLSLTNGRIQLPKASYKIIKPIPLTEEWLINFGFEIYAKSDVCNGWSIGENPVTKDYLMTLTWMKNENGSLAECFYRNGHFVIKYVHQLQNLYFALTGEELEVK